jgi:hypothetical protein
LAATNFGQFWPSAWTTDSVITGLSVTSGANSPNSATIKNSAASPNEVLDTECEITVTYGGTITGGGAIVYICRECNGGFESPANDAPYSFLLPVVASATCKRVFTVPGRVGGFQIVVGSPSGTPLSAVTLYSRQSQGQSG